MPARRVVGLLVAALLFYLVVVAQRGVLLVRDGRPAAVLLGVGVLLLPVIGLWVVVSELRFGRATERLAHDLPHEDGDAPMHEVDAPAAAEPVKGDRHRAARDRTAADAAWARRRAAVEASPEDWVAWYRLAVAYADAGDTARGRRAMRRAIALHDGTHHGS